MLDIENHPHICFMERKIFILSLGCPRNLVDSEVLTGLLKKEGFSFTEHPEKAGIFIINTCAFIESAKKESIDMILQAVTLKKESHSGNYLIIVAGCLSQRYPREIKDEIPEINAIFGTSDFPGIPRFIKEVSIRKKNKYAGKKNINVRKKPNFLYNDSSPRDFITPSHYAYIKLQEGCRNFCSYCVIPKLRGPYRSRVFGSILKEAEMLRKKGVQEINLIGQDTTLYGVDRYRNIRLVELLRKLSNIMKGGWVRLLYTHPAHCSDELINVIAGEEAVCKYLDIPVQHINDKILRSMNRLVTKDEIIDLIGKIRKKVPRITIRSTVMVGFPGETEKEFRELLSFIKSAKFEKLGAFIYSREEGTPAYSFMDQIPEVLKKERYDRVLTLQQEISAEKNKEFFGKTFKILIDEKDKLMHTQFLGRSQMDAPEVDGICYVRSNKPNKPLAVGSFQYARIIDTLEYDLVAETL